MGDARLLHLPYDWRTTRCFGPACDATFVVTAPEVGTVAACPRCGTESVVIDVKAPYYIRTRAAREASDD